MNRLGLWGLLLLATSSVCAQTPAATVLTLAADSGGPAVRQLIHLSVTLNGAMNATGVVTFSDGGSAIASVALNQQGPTYLGVASLRAGNHLLTAAYSGDAFNAPSQSSLALTVSGIPVSFTASALPTTLYANAPLILSALNLPADATGSITFSDQSSTLADLAITGTLVAEYQAFGDLITAESHPGVYLQRYVDQVASVYDYALSNYASGSAATCDILPFQMLINQLGPTQAHSPLSSIMVGTNDVDLHGGNYEALFHQCHQATLAWLAIPREYKILPNDPGVTILSGLWTADPSFNLTTYGTLFNASGSGTASFSITTAGAPIYLWYLIGDQLDGNFTVAVDGNPTAHSYSTQPSTPINSLSSPSIGYALLRLPAAQGPHTVEITSHFGSVGVLAVATPPSPGITSVHPTVLRSDIPSQLSTNPATPAATIASYTLDIEDDIALLAGDGLDLRPVSTESFMFGSPAEMNDQVNPNGFGQAHLAQAIESVLTGVSSQPFTAFINTVPTASVSLANPGVRILTATYSGDSVYAPSSATVSIGVLAQSISATTLTASVNHATFGSAIVLTTTVAPANATGTVTFYDGTEVLAVLPLAKGTSVFESSNLAVGTHNLLASYTGDSADTASASPLLAVEIDAAPTTLTLVSLPAVVTYTPAFTLSAAILPSSATRTITFFDGTTSLGQAPLTSGMASVTITLPIGSHKITARYGGDGNDLPTVSTAETVVVQSVATTLTLASLPPSAVYGSVLTLAANIAPASATGTVNFTDNPGGILAQVSVLGGAASTNIDSLGVGTHNIRAVYSGDTLNAASTSSAGTTLITPDPTVTTLTLGQGSIAGSPVTFNVAVSNALGLNPTGTVALRSGALTLSQGQLINASNGLAYATLSINATVLGSSTVSASYAGDANDLASTSALFTYAVAAMPTVATLSLSATRVLVQTPVTVTAVVASAKAIPTGSMIFMSNAKAIATVPVNTLGQASTTISSPSEGDFVVTASYVPTGIFVASAAGPESLMVTAPIALTVSPTSLNANPGSARSATLTIIPLLGFSGSITGVCRSPQTWLTCSVAAPSSVSGNPVNAPVSITLKTSSAAAIFPLFTLLLCPLLFDRRRRRYLLSLLFSVVMLGATACTEGGDFFNLPNGPQQLTLAVTAAGITVTTPLTINISQ